jgi:hypothetical protein
MSALYASFEVLSQELFQWSNDERHAVSLSLPKSTPIYDHSGEQFTRRSRTGWVVYLNKAPIVWFSKCQPAVESSVFGAEFAAINNGIQTCHGLHYMLIMIDLPLSGPIYVYGDNMSGVHNTQHLASVLKKK